MKSNGNRKEENLASAVMSSKMPTSSVGVVRLLNQLLHNLSPALKVVLAISGLIIAFWYGNKLMTRLISSQEELGTALQSKPLTSSHSQVGMGSFVSPSADKILPTNKDDYGNTGAILTQIETEMKDLREGRKPFNLNKVFDSLNLIVSPDSAPSWEQTIKMETSNGMVMMISASLLKRKLGAKPLTQANLKEVLVNESPEILLDFYLGSLISTLLKKLADEKIHSLPIVQFYWISQSGLILLGSSSSNELYKRKFPPHTLFQKSPYFSGAIEGRKKNIKYGPFHHRTEPYIDLGGNGLVITYSMAVDLPGQRVGVLCADMKPQSEQYLRDRLIALRADVKKFSWIIHPDGTAVKDGVVPTDFEWVDTALTSKHQEEQSVIWGGIACEPHDPAQQKSKLDVVRCTVPLESTPYNKDRRATLLLVTIDFAGNHAELTRHLFFFSGGIILLVLSSWNIFLDFFFQNRELNGIYTRFAEVMKEARNPFVILDAKNGFREVNGAFLKLLGYENIEELKKEKSTFRSLITTETQPIYDRVLAQSGKGRRTGKYRIDIYTRKRETLSVLVHGERIPYPTFWRRGLPHRFGIFLEWHDKNGVWQHEMKVGQSILPPELHLSDVMNNADV